MNERNIEIIAQAALRKRREMGIPAPRPAPKSSLDIRDQPCKIAICPVAIDPGTAVAKGCIDPLLPGPRVDIENGTYFFQESRKALTPIEEQTREMAAEEFVKHKGLKMIAFTYDPIRQERTGGVIE